MKVPVPEADSDQINLIPLIDVFLVLLIFFLVATHMSEDEREISVRLAQVARPSRWPCRPTRSWST